MSSGLPGSRVTSGMSRSLLELVFGSPEELGGGVASYNNLLLLLFSCWSIVLCLLLGLKGSSLEKISKTS